MYNKAKSKEEYYKMIGREVHKINQMKKSVK